MPNLQRPTSSSFVASCGTDNIMKLWHTCPPDGEIRDLAHAAAHPSPLSVGRGMLHCAHGKFPVPAPATLEIIAGRSIPCKEGPLDGEFLTPTGAALLSVMVNSFESMPPLCPERTGYGAGYNDYSGHANLLQATIGRLC